MTLMLGRVLVAFGVAQIVASAGVHTSGVSAEDRVVESLAEIAAYRARTEDAVRFVKKNQASRSGEYTTLQSRYTAAARAFGAYLEALARANEDPTNKLDAADAAAEAEQAQRLLDKTLAGLRGESTKGFAIAIPALMHLVLHVLDLPAKSKERKHLRDILADSRWHRWEDIQ